MRGKPYLILILSLTIIKVTAQFNDLTRIDYTLLPSTSDFEFNPTRFLFNYPIKLNDKKRLSICGIGL